MDLKENGSEQEAQHSFAVAEKYYRLALSEAKKIGAYSNQYLETEARIANVCLLQHKDQVAEKHYQNVIKLLAGKKRDKTLHRETMIWVEDLANTYTDMSKGNSEQSLRYLLHALKIRDIISGDSHPDLSTTLWRLCMAYSGRGNYAAVEPLATRMLKVDQLRSGRDSERVAHDLTTLGVAKYNLGRHTEAESYIRQALDIYASKENSKPLAVGMTRTQLAHILRSQKQYKLAETEAKSALAWMERHFGKNKTNTNAYRELVAEILVDEGKNVEANTYFQKALAIEEATYGKNSPRLIGILKRLKTFYNRQKAYSKEKKVEARIQSLAKAKAK